MLESLQKQPLAARMRPRTLEEYVGQEHIVGKGRLLRRAIQADHLSSVVFSGPPGSGKTTLARVIAERTECKFLALNAVLSGVSDIRKTVEAAQKLQQEEKLRTMLFVDEVHRWSKSQQDALLPWVENGLIILIGATTENPFFEVNRALLSRSRVFVLQALSEQNIRRVVYAALYDTERGYGSMSITIDDEAMEHLIHTASGDARSALNALELAVETSAPDTQAQDCLHITLSIMEDSIQQRAVLYDKDGDYHYDIISAFIKSVRGSDADAALYWLARMSYAGEDPRYILRRLLILASEDIGLADPMAIVVVQACAHAFDRVGMPEGQLHIIHAVLYLSNAEKSNSVLGYYDALSAVKKAEKDEVPLHLRDKHRDAESLGHGKGYKYPHAYHEHWVAQHYLPPELGNKIFYTPGRLGWEGDRAAALQEHRQLREAQQHERAVWVGSCSHTQFWQARNVEHSSEQLRELRSKLLHNLPFMRTCRVLLAGNAVQLLVWECLRHTPEGLTAVWTDERNAVVLQRQCKEIAAASGSLPSVEVSLPQIALWQAGSALPAALYKPVSSAPSGQAEISTPHTSPFDIIIHRGMMHHDTIQQCLLPLLVSGGLLRIIEVDAIHSTLPSSVLHMPQQQKKQLIEAEKQAFSSREEHWKNAAPSCTIRKVEHAVTRHITIDTIRSWFSAGSPLHKVLGEKASAHIVQHAQPPQNDTQEWRRIILLVDIHKDSP